MAGRAGNRDSDGRKLPWRPPGAPEPAAKDLPHAKERARYRRKPDGVPSKPLGADARDLAQLRSLVRAMEEPAVTADPTIRPALMTDAQLLQLVKDLQRAERYDWRAHARPDQLQPPEYRTWLYMAGRGAGKSRASAEAVREWCQTPDVRVAVMAKDSKTLRDFCFEGVSGLISVFPPEEIKHYFKGLGDCRIELTNGGKIMGFSAEAPDSMRGGSFHKAWGDEFAAWPKNLAQDALDQIWFTLRESERPQIILSTTPKRVPHVQQLMDRADTDPTVVVTKGKTSDNTALSAAALEELYARYGGTHLGRQELNGEMLDDVEGALWTPLMIEFARLADGHELPKFRKIICAVDPSGSAKGDATGIVVVAYTFDRRLFVLGCYSTKGLAAERYNAVCRAAVKHGANEILYESNFSGDNAALGIENQWKHLRQIGEILTVMPRIKASTLRGDKAVKASPVAALYEQQANIGVERIFHVAENRANGLAILESELISWAVTDKASPNSLDALVIGARRAMQECGLEVVAGAATHRRLRGGSGAY